MGKFSDLLNEHEELSNSVNNCKDPMVREKLRKSLKKTFDKLLDVACDVQINGDNEDKKASKQLETLDNN